MNIDFARNLKNARRRAGLSQVRAAARAGMPQSSWSDYERGRVKPSIEMADRLADALGVPLTALLRPAAKIRNSKLEIRNSEGKKGDRI